MDQKLNEQLKATDSQYNKAVSAMNKQEADQQNKTLIKQGDKLMNNKIDEQLKTTDLKYEKLNKQLGIKMSNHNIVVMNKSNLNNLSKSHFIDLLLKARSTKTNSKTKTPVPAPRTKVVELPIGAMLKVEKPIPKPRTKKNPPIPTPRTKITPVKRALKDTVEK